MRSSLADVPMREMRDCMRLIARIMLGEPEAYAELLNLAPDWGNAGRAGFLEVARREKCFSQCAGLLCDQLGTAALAQLDEQYRINAEGRRITLALPASAILLKGMALAACYPNGIVRDSLDVDVCVPDLRVAGEIAAKMRPMGYECESTALWGRPLQEGSETPAGAVRFTATGGAGKYRDASLELHLGGFTTSLATSILYEEWKERATPSTVPGLQCLQLDATSQLCLMLTDYCVRVSSPVCLRHVVDMVHFLNRHSTRIDRERMAGFLARHHLGEGQRRLLTKAEECGVRGQLAPYLELLCIGGTDKPLDPRKEYRRRVFRAPPQAGRPVVQRALAVLLFQLRAALLEFAKIKWLQRLLVSIERAEMTWFFYNAGMRVAVTPISRQCVPQVAVRIVGGALFYETPMGVFSMSLHGFVDDVKRWELYRIYAKNMVAAQGEQGRNLT